MVHIMMAACNGGKFISEQIDSILAQTYTGWRLYVSDDGSTDNTVSVVKQYEKKHPDRIFLLDHSAVFHSARENFAYLYRAVPPAEYYAFCDQDDIWEAGKLDCMVRCMERSCGNVPAVAYHDMKVVKSRQCIIAESFCDYTGCRLRNRNQLQQILLYNVAPGCAMVFNHRLKEMVTEIPPECIMHDWWLMLAALCLGGRVVYCSQKLGLYRQHGRNQIGAVRKKPLISILLKCLDFFRIKYYIANNRKIKLERFRQAQALLDCYRDRMGSENIYVLEQFLYLLSCRRKLCACHDALKNGYIFFNRVFTVKLFLL